MIALARQMIFMEKHMAYARSCPFCGWEPNMFDTRDFVYPVGRLKDLMQAVCKDCGAATLGEDFETALASWNRRPNHINVD
jgi:hypothetical protein